MFVIRTCSVAACFALASLFGAGQGALADEIATVSGIITLDGQPLAGGRIFFHQEDGQFVGARIDKELGKFKLARIPAGKYKVTVESKGVPDKFSADERALLLVEIKSGEHMFNFDLTSK